MVNPKFLILIGLILVLQISLAVKIEVGIKEKIDAKIVSIDEKGKNSLKIFEVEVYNTGSVPFKAWLRLDAEGKSFFSPKKELKPGERKVFNLVTFFEKAGLHNSTLTLFYGYSTYQKNFMFEIKNVSWNEQVDVLSYRVYQDAMVFDLISNSTTKAYAIPYSTSPTFISFPTLIDLEKSKVSTFKIDYYLQVFYPFKLNLAIVDESGNILCLKEFWIEKQETGLIGLLHLLLDLIKLRF